MLNARSWVHTFILLAAQGSVVPLAARFGLVASDYHCDAPPTLSKFSAGRRHWARLAPRFASYRIILLGVVVLVLFFTAVISPKAVTTMYHPQIDKKSVSLKLLMITLEFRKGTFSGNGVYAQSIARSLAARGNEVLVISGKSVKHIGSTNMVNNMKQTNMHEGKAWAHQTTNGKTLHTTRMDSASQSSNSRVHELEVEVDEADWGRLDWTCSWRRFAQGIAIHAEHVLEFSPSWALVVDWSAVEAFQSLSLATGIYWRMAFLNFRIYTVSEYQGDQGEAEKHFYEDMESKAVSMASAVSALSTRDAHILATQLGGGLRNGVVPKPLFPPLREDLRGLALAGEVDSEEFQTTEKWNGRRLFFTCCVRLSPEKNGELYAALIEYLAPFLRQQKILPFLCGGAKGESSYAERVKTRINAVMPEAIIHEGFMGASDLAHLYSRTLLNFHPCIYDAYGMTIIEAAAFAAPSIVHVGPGGAVGAAEFLDPSEGQVLALNLAVAPATIADNIKNLLLDKKLLARIGQTSSRRSLSWNEDANANELINILESAPQLPCSKCAT